MSVGAGLGSVTRLGRSLPGGWVMTLCPSAGEASASFQSSRRRRAVWVPAGSAADPERARREASRRARSKLRRYCAGNGLNRLGTLTYAGDGCHDPLQLRRDIAVFFRVLRRLLGGKPIPYAWVAEWHPGGHGLHVHFALGRFVNRALIDQAWGHGFVSIKLLGDLPVGSTSWDEARLAARYLSKYVAKSFQDQTTPVGLHRYELAQGFTPRAERITGPTLGAVLGEACGRMGRAPRQSWNSDTDTTWQGPPASWVAW